MYTPAPPRPPPPPTAGRRPDHRLQLSRRKGTPGCCSSSPTRQGHSERGRQPASWRRSPGGQRHPGWGRGLSGRRMGGSREAGWRRRAGGPAGRPHFPHHPRGPCPQHPCLLGAPHPPDRVRCSSCWPQDPGRRVGTVAPAPSGRAQHSHALGPARSLGDGGGGEWRMGTRQETLRGPAKGPTAPPPPRGSPLRCPPRPSPAPLTCATCTGLQATGCPLLGGPGAGGTTILGRGVHTASPTTPMAAPTRDAAGPPGLPLSPRPSHCGGAGGRTGVNQAVNPKSCHPARESRAKGRGNLGSGQRGGLRQRPKASAASSRVPEKPP